jgi:AraC-like DNA-binding protein
MDPRVSEAIAIIRKNLHREEISVGWLAGQFGLSGSRFSHLFKKEAGLPPAAMIRALRISLTKDLLQDRKLTIKEVMIRVGINDKSHFVHFFKSAVGVTPTEYRRRQNIGRQGWESASVAGKINK